MIKTYLTIFQVSNNIDIYSYREHRGQTLHACARPQKSAGKTKANCIQKSRKLKKTKNIRKRLEIYGSEFLSIFLMFSLSLPPRNFIYPFS